MSLSAQARQAAPPEAVSGTPVGLLERLAARNPVEVRHFGWWLTGIAAVALVLRVTYVFLAWNLPQGLYGHAFGGLNGDGVDYHFLALHNLEGQWFVRTSGSGPVALHPPAWPLVLTLVGALGLKSWLEQQIFTTLIGVATVVMVGFAGRQIAGARAGLLAGAIAAVYAGMWVYERDLLSEPLVMLLLASLIIVAYRFRERPTRWGAVGLGLLCGLLAMTRAEQVLLFVLVVIPLILGRRRIALASRLRWLVAAGACLLVVIAPWTIFNLPRFHQPVLLSLGTGSAAVVANCPIAYQGPWIGSYSLDCARPTTGDASDQARQDQTIAFDYVKDHLSQFPLVAVAREGRAFGFWNAFQQTHRDSDWQKTPLWVNRLGLWSFWLLVGPAVGGALVLRRRRVLIYPLVASFAITALAVMITYGETRYRAPSEVALVLLAAVFLDAVVPRRTATSDQPAPSA